MKQLWSKDTEKKFFNESFDFATPEQLFNLSNDSRYFAYWPKTYKGKTSTLQSRNSLIGSFSEKWTTDLLQEIASNLGLYAVKGAVCEQLSLPKNSSADVVISTSKDVYQKAENIRAIIEVKMSIVWNWEYKDRALYCLGDYHTHKGNPGLLRSDSMLKAIGKSINVRISCSKASSIPIIVMGNTPITKNYYSKVDHLKRTGIIQGFCSVNPNPSDIRVTELKQTKGKGFIKFDDYEELKSSFVSLLSENRYYFSSMKTNLELGKIIEQANLEVTYEKKAEKFLELLKEN